MPRYKLTVAYDGSDFHGWQKQQRADDLENGADVDLESPGTAIPGSGEPVRTVQSVLEAAVREVVREPVIIVGASRTDSGVHARGQVAAFTSQAEIPVQKLPRAIRARLPDDVQVLKAELVDDQFDPIKHAIAKGYRYQLAYGCARRRRPLFDRKFVTWTAYALDPGRMNAAARLLLGAHDFTSFTRLHHGRESTVRTIYECKVTATSKRRCRIDVAGNGFLYNMVRIIAGTLVEVGRGVLEPESALTILAAKDRRAAGPTLGPSGLCLMWIRY